MMNNRLPLLAIPLLPLLGCVTPGERTNGHCPSGETCSPDTPNGLLFQGSPVAPVGLFADNTVKTIAVGGTQTVTVLNNGGAGGVFTLPFDAATTGQLSVASSTPPTVSLHADALGEGYLRVLQSGTNLLYDRVSVSTEELDHVIVAPAEMNGINDDAFDPGTSPWAAWAGGDVTAYVGLYDSTDNRLVDESMAITGAVATQPAWDTVTINATAPVDLTINAGDKTGLPLTIDVQSHIDTIAAVTALGVDPSKPQPLGIATICFEAEAGTEAVVGAPWAFSITSGTATASQSVLAPNCVNLNPTAAGTVMVQVDGGDAEVTVPIVFAAAKPSPRPATPERQPASTAGERASVSE